MHVLITEGLGYLATFFLAISLMITNDLKFRWVNAMGCLSFILYGVFLNAIPLIISNALLLSINLYYLVKIYRTQEDFDLMEFKGDEKLILKFLSFYKKDISKYFPDYAHYPENDTVNFVILRDLVIANVFVGKRLDNGTVIVLLNYTLEKYRDFEIGKFLFKKKKLFLESKGIKRMEYPVVSNKGHQKFLKVMEFKKLGETFYKDITE